MSDALRRAAASLDTLRQTFTQLTNGPQIGCRVFSTFGEVPCPDGFTIVRGEGIEAEGLAMKHFGASAPGEAVQLPDGCPELDALAETFRFTHTGEPIKLIRPRHYLYTLFTPRKLTLPAELAEFRAAESAIGRLSAAAESASQCLATVPLGQLSWLDLRTPLTSGLFGGRWFNVVFDLAARGLVGACAPRQRAWRRDTLTCLLPWEPRHKATNGVRAALDPHKEIIDFYGGVARLPDFFGATIPDFPLASALAAGVLADDLRRLADDSATVGRPNGQPHNPANSPLTHASEKGVSAMQALNNSGRTDDVFRTAAAAARALKIFAHKHEDPPIGGKLAAELKRLDLELGTACLRAGLAMPDCSEPAGGRVTPFGFAKLPVVYCFHSGQTTPMRKGAGFGEAMRWLTAEAKKAGEAERLLWLRPSPAWDQAMDLLVAAAENGCQSAGANPRPVVVAAAETSPAPAASPLPTSPPVVLGGPNDEPTVRGKKKPKLTPARYNVVKAMLSANRPLTKDELDAKSGHTEARKILKALADSDPDWKTVIHFGGQTGGGYWIE